VAEAAEKCARAKALTKEWRASMDPKPDVEWVKMALTKLGIRVVNDRPGRRRKDEEIQQDNKPNTARKSTNNSGAGFLNSGMYQHSHRNIRRHADRGEGMMSVNAAMAEVPNEISTNAFDLYHNSVGGVSNIPTREETGFNPEDFSNLMQQSRMGLLNDADVNASSFQFAGPAPGMESASASRQYYAILKEHHDNLLKELQRTTYMMQIYQRNYEAMEDQPPNIMGNAMFGSDVMGISMWGQSFGNRMQPSFRQAQALDPSMQYNSLGGSGEFALAQRNQGSGMDQGVRNQGGGMNLGAMSYFQSGEADNDGEFQIQNQNSNAAYQEMQQQQQMLQQQQFTNTGAGNANVKLDGKLENR
jgi:hypothetical protein